ncbi:class I SAM-dependent methyltransferase [Streptomyces sp. WP-1]|uniref:class I SAM-dependent methyltransferase n=1 Tax=Streptomyces sp. WP-1 TaxID=3041497 RepID=UPI002647A900|nr:class I SAM-dependent methyltransferase [Streptomyces sp. WP-1]WKE72419.1 class I SAM-dependent methyltransferase [Streptomyces sp. WP-1]
MPMNYPHRKICSSARWAAGVAERMPELLAGVDLGDDVLEIGPGFGATTRALLSHLAKAAPATRAAPATGSSAAARLTAVEIDRASAALLRAEFAGRAEIVHGDGTRLPFPDGRFSAVVCFTMLHHVPSAELQDALFAEACRVLRPGGVFRGVDSLPSLRFRLLHIGDTMLVLDPGTLPGRLYRSGFEDVESRQPGDRQIRFLARKG